MCLLEYITYQSCFDVKDINDEICAIYYSNITLIKSIGVHEIGTKFDILILDFKNSKIDIWEGNTCIGEYAFNVQIGEKL